MTVLTASAFGALFGLGIVLLAAGAAGVMPSGTPSSVTRVSHAADRLILRSALGVIGAAIAFGVTGWLVGAVAVGVGAASAPSVWGARRRRSEAIARTEAIAAWAEMLRDTMAAAAGLEEAVTTTARVAPPAIRREVQALAKRLEREPFVPSVRHLAADLADPVGDIVTAALILAAERQAGSLGEVLGAAAASARSSATMRLRVEAGRARVYTSTRMIVGVTVTFAVGLVLFNRRYLEPFDTAGGQAMLAVVAALFGSGLWSLSRLARPEDAARFLVSSSSTGGR